MFTHLIISITALFFIIQLFKKSDRAETEWIALTEYCQLECLASRKSVTPNTHSKSGLSVPTLIDPIPRSDDWGEFHG